MALERSRALWNRTRVDLRSHEILAQLLERGELEAWRELHALARTDARLRARLLHVVKTVPLPFGHFWLAALAGLDPTIDVETPLPREVPGT
jgi:hypothetical protein